uniref:Uncharacterized protein n=1 Tax=Glossina pallidipes TaxID=7398 RepID=A0A1A9ZG22_GLOPL
MSVFWPGVNETTAATMIAMNQRARKIRVTNDMTNSPPPTPLQSLLSHIYINSPKVLVFDRHDTLIVANKPPIEQHYWRQAKQCTCLQFGLIVALKSFTVHLFVFRDSIQALEFAHDPCTVCENIIKLKIKP